MVAVAMETGLGLPDRDRRGRHRPALDLRLAVPAAALWAGAAAAGAWPPPPWLLAAVAAVLVGCLPAAWLLLRRDQVLRREQGLSHEGERGGRRSRAGEQGRAGLSQPRRAGAATLVAALAFLAAGALAAGVAARPRVAGPLAELARSGAAVQARLVLTDDPRATEASSGPMGDGGGSVVVRARLTELTAAGSTARRPAAAALRAPGPAAGRERVSLRASVPVLVIARDRQWLDLLPSQRVVVRAGLVPPEPGDTVAAVLFARAPPELAGGPSTLQRVAGKLRSGLREAAGVLPQPARGLLPALVVGDTSGLTAQLREDFRAAGMSHLTAVSGANLAIVTAAVLAVLGRTPVGLRSRVLWAAAALLGFVVLARPSASVLRAGAMGLIGLLAVALGRPRAVFPALAAAVIVLVLADPALARSAGFALSVLATAGMVVWGPGWRDALARRLPGRIAEVLAVAAAAQLACGPVLAWLGEGVSLAAIPANVAAAPAVPPATVLGVLALVAAVVHDPTAELLARLGGLGCRWLVGVAGVAADVPGATVGWPAGAGGALAATAVTVAAVAALRRRVPRRLLAAAVVGVLLARLLVLPRLDGWPPAGWQMAACDVGQGDALVLAAAPGSGVLVDVGGDPALLAACLADLGVRRVPLVLLSHLHADHAAGLAGVLGRLPVGEVVVGPLHEPAQQWRQVRALARAAGVPVRTVAAGAAGAAGAVRWQVIAPAGVPGGARGEEVNPNDASLVVHAVVDGMSLLLTGDAEPPEQAQVVRAGVPRADVLKVPHHGAAEQDPRLLTGTGAAVAVISVGAGNTYGHPAPRTLAILAGAGMTVARTDRHGPVALVRDDDGPIRVVVRRPRAGS